MFGFPRLKETVADAPGGQELIDRVLARPRRPSPGRTPSRRTTSRWSRSQRSGGATRVSAASNGTVLAEFELPSAPGNERQAMERVERAVRRPRPRRRRASSA